MKPGIRVKNPQLLAVGDHSWIGEDAWIDNLEAVEIADHACISQGAYLCTGNHDWSDPAFALRSAPILLERGTWVGARAVIGPGVVLQDHAVVTAGSVVTKSVPAFCVFGGNPAVFLRQRKFKGTIPSDDECTWAGDRDRT